MPFEMTLAIIKPDAVAEGHVGEVISAYEARGLRIEALSLVRLTRERAAEFYSEHDTRDFFDALLDYMTSGKCLALAVSGDGAIEAVREANGHTDPSLASPGTIRARFGKNITWNAVHGSEHAVAAARELCFFFPDLRPS